MNFRNRALKYGARVGAGTALLAPYFANATSAYSSITTAVDWSDVVTAVTAIAALVAAVLVVKRGSKMLLSMIGK